MSNSFGYKFVDKRKIKELSEEMWSYETWGRNSSEEEWVKLPHGDFVKSEKKYWFNQSNPQTLLKVGNNIDTTYQRAKEFQDAHDCNYDVVYYLGIATPENSGDEALKWIMGPLLSEMNAKKIPISEISKFLPASYLNYFIKNLLGGKFDRNTAKAIFAEMLTLPFEKYGGHETQLDQLFSDPKYKTVDINEIESIVKQLIQENPQQATQAKENEKLLQWFVGQTMKASKGKANPQQALELIKKNII